MNRQEQEYNIQNFNLVTSLLAILNQNAENNTNFVIARYFLQHLDDIKNTSIYTVAEECFVSRSSIQRFIKNLGFESYTRLKAGIDTVRSHEEGFIDYTGHSRYTEYISDSIASMIADISANAKGSSFRRLVDKFMQSPNVVILTAEDSSMACRSLQQQVLSFGKLIRIISSASNNISLLDTLKPEDLLLVCSVTGNYALAISHQLPNISAEKCLITLNRNAAFERDYALIYYLGDKVSFNSRDIIKAKNVYNNYGLSFFFDLFYHECYMRYGR